MITGLPLAVSLLFFLTSLVTIGFFYFALRSSPRLAGRTLLFLLVWMILQSLLAFSGFLTDTSGMPPRIFMAIAPSLLVIALLFATAKGRAYIDQLNLETLTWMHTIRIPVEITLVLLYQHGHITVNQTMEGSNFDIISGVTAPLVAWFGIRAGKMRRGSLIAWNALCFVLLLNVVITSALAIPGPMQQISFAGRSFAVLYFPFNLLPTLVVPLVLFAHLAAFRKLSKRGLTTVTGPNIDGAVTPS
jgi:hypothetical protein